MVTRADRHSGQRGISGPLFVFLDCRGYLRRGRRALGCRCCETGPERGDDRGWEPGRLPPGGTQLGVVSSLLVPSVVAAALSVRPGRTWMRLGVASSALGTMICSTPSL